MTSQMRSMLLIVVALLIAGLVAFAVRGRIEPAAPVVQQAPQTAKIMVAVKDIPVGGFVQEGRDIGFAEFPEASIQPFHLREGAAQLTDFNGAVARRAVKTGEPITNEIVIKPGSGGFMAAVLEPGMRAVSIAVNPTSGNAGFVFPGDRVDLLLTHKVTLAGQEGVSEDSTVSETFIQNVRVVAVDQALDNPENKAILAKTVTVEVMPQQAEKINVAAEIGKISVALRSLASMPPVPVLDDLPPVPVLTSDRDVSPLLNRNGELVPSVRVIRGNAAQKMQFYRGNP